MRRIMSARTNETSNFTLSRTQNIVFLSLLLYTIFWFIQVYFFTSFQNLRNTSEVSASTNNDRVDGYNPTSSSHHIFGQQEERVEYKPSNDVASPQSIDFASNAASLSKQNFDQLPFTAFLEPAVSYWDLKEKSPKNTFGDPITPLPLRTQSPSNLTKIIYPKIQSCSDIPAKLPIIRGLETDSKGELIFQNVKNEKVLLDPMKEAHVCPVDADPFLPWIHDIFPSLDGTKIQFVAQNKRRCNTGKKFKIEMDRLEPQFSLLQPVSVTELTSLEDMPLNMWNQTSEMEDEVESVKEKRWRLSTLEEANPDGKYTRFICRFKSVVSSNNNGGITKTINLGETLSVYSVNYEFVHMRKGYKAMISKGEPDKGSFWLSSYQFDCPVPSEVNKLQDTIKHGTSIINNKATLYVDLIPIRTPPRVGDGFHFESSGQFDAAARWGQHHVLPKIEASGRWQNIPICRPHHHSDTKQGLTTNLEDKNEKNLEVTDIPDQKKDYENGDKPNYLVGCLWASAMYKTRNDGVYVSDTRDRLIEWLDFHFMVGFDHIYIYDNTAAHVSPEDYTNTTGLLDIISEYYSPNEVTYIEWPMRVCNNNFPQNENAGERSSQYAAESSCRVRYGPQTTWMASFDTDEYFIPSGKYTNLKDLLSDSEEKGINILSFKSARGFMDVNHTVPYFDGDTCGTSLNTSVCLQKSPNSTFLETFNADPVGLPREKYERAKKQIYRPDHVLSHFVHYSTITKPMADLSAPRRKYAEPISSERFTDELNEAFMLHSKMVRFTDTIHWKDRCKFGYVLDKWGLEKCRVGIPFKSEIKNIAQADTLKDNEKLDSENFVYNAFRYDRVADYWVPRLEAAIQKRLNKSTREKRQ